MRSTSSNLTNDEMQDDKVLAMLATEASTLKLDDVGKTILMVKPGDSIKEVNKNLTSASSQALARTYAHLTNLKEDEEDVTKFLKEGLVEMIFYRLKQLMPAGCKKCNKVHVNGREEVPQVTCRMCGIGACKDCYPVEEAMGKWSFLCGECDKSVSKMMGEDALKPGLFSAAYKKKKSGKERATPTVENEDGEIEEENDEEKEENGEKENVEVEIVEDDFQEVKNTQRGFKAKKTVTKPEKDKKENDGEKKEPICHHFKKARCHHGMSGKQSYNGIAKCPFRHPMICQKLLRNGDRGRGGCRGKEAGCNEFHQVKMCYSSMNSKKCSNGKDCSNGYHVKGTVMTKANPVMKEKEDYPALPTNASGPKVPQPTKGQEKQLVTEASNDSNLSSFLGQLLLQQQEMMQQQQQARQEQLQMQQQMMHLMSRMAGPTESRAPTPMMGVMPSNLMGTQAFRGVGA